MPLNTSVSGNFDFNAGTLYIDSATNRIGIGTITPSNILDVRGQGNFSGTIYINNATDISTLGGGIPIVLNNSYEVYFNQSYPTFINISNLLFVNKTLGNVGIGTTTPTEKLTVNGNVSLNNTLYVLENGDVRIRTTGSANTNTFIVNGSMTIGKGVGGSLEENNDAILGLSRSATAGYGMLIFQTGSSTTDSWTVGMLDGEADFVFDTSYGGGTGKRLVIQNATGNVGINTTSPTTALHVAGTLNVANIVLESNCAEGQVLKWSAQGIGTCGADSIAGYWNLTGNNLFPASMDYNVGIGTTSPGAKLQVYSGGTGDAVQISGDNSSKYIFLKGNNLGYGSIGYWNGTGYGNLIVEGSNVGIGTTSPLGKFVVVTDDDTMFNPSAFDQKHSVLAGSGSEGLFVSYNRTSNTANIAALHPAVVWGNLALQPISGNVGIGTTSPASKLSIGGSGISPATIYTISPGGSNAYGIFAETSTGVAVYGYSPSSGFGVIGESDSGNGVYGYSATGYAGNFGGRLNYGVSGGSYAISVCTSALGSGTFGSCSSGKTYKKDIIYLNNYSLDSKNVIVADTRFLKGILSTPIINYRHINDSSNNELRIGIIAEDAPFELQIIDEFNNTNLDWMSYYGYMWGGIQELTVQNIEQQTQI